MKITCNYELEVEGSIVLKEAQQTTPYPWLKECFDSFIKSHIIWLKRTVEALVRTKKESSNTINQLLLSRRIQFNIFKLRSFY